MKLTRRLHRSQLIIFLMCLTAVLITILGVIFKQDLWRIIPLYISLIIAFLQSRVNRFAPLIGSVNAVLYGAVYFYYGLYASCLYAVLISAPLQLATFIRWQKNRYEKTTYFRILSIKQRYLISGCFIACWSVLYIILSFLNSAFLLLDNTVTLLGILATILMMLSFIEYTVLLLVGNISTVALYTAMISDNPEQITYLVYSIYALICSIAALFEMRKIYSSQKGNNLKTSK